MPQGPGEDILDAIEGGKGDDVILKQYKIDADQLKAFKGLHYGLSNQKMALSEIKDYYPELESYFKLAPSLPKDPGNAATSAATTIEKPDFTKPVREKKVAESTAPSLKASQQLAEGVLPGGTLQDKFDKKIAASQESLHKELRSNDDVVEKMIRTHRYDQAEQQGYDRFANAPRSDMPATAMLAGVRNRAIKPEMKPQDLPVAPEEIGKLKSEIETNEPQARQFVNQVVVQKPDKAKELQESIYMLDANERLKANPEIGLKVNENLNGIKEGKYKYNAQTRQVIEELDFVDGLVSGVKERTQQLENYNLKSLTPEERIKIMEQRLAAYDPDKPVQMPKGAGEFSQMLGMEWASILKSTATGVVTSLVGGEGAAPYISAAINAPEYYKRGYSSGYQQSYNELRQQGKSPEEADKLATEQAETEGKLGAAEGFVSSIVGGRIGIKELPKFKLTGGVKGAFNNMLKQTVHFAAETSIEGAADGLVAAVLQDQMNIAAREKGMFRDDASVKEAFMGELQFALATGGVVQAARGLVDPNTYKKLLYFLGQQPKETVQQKVGDMVLSGEMTQEQADDVITKTKEQAAVDKTVPEDINDVSRIAMIEKIKERDALEEKKKTVDKALLPPIQEQIDNLNKEILEHSTHIKETNETETKTEAQTETGTGGITNQTTSDQAGAEQSTVGAGETAATAPDPSEMHYTNPEGTKYVLRDNKLFHVKGDGTEVAFSDQAMKAKSTQDLVAKIKEANTQPAQQAESPAVKEKIETEEDVQTALKETYRQKAGDIAQKIRAAKRGGKEAFGGLLGVSVAVYDGMLETAATIIEAGGSIADALKAAVAHIQQHDPTIPEDEIRDAVHKNFIASGVIASDDQVQAVEKIIKKTPATVTNDKLAQQIQAATGMPMQEVVDMIETIRNPKVPPAPIIPTYNLSPESRNISLNKFKRLFEKPTVKKPNWFQRQWESLKNASAWIENPYRFITKITEDINKAYGLENKEQIPLGRQFEKVAAGRAALKVQSFVNEIINGNIGNRKLGKLRGEKYQDFQMYLAAKRVLDRLNQQEAKAQAGEDVNRQTGNITRQDAEVQLEELFKKYGNLDDFDARAKAFQAHMDTMLRNLVASGILSRDVYDQIKADNDFYAPFSVVQEKLLADQKAQPVGISGVIKRIKGIDYSVLKTTGKVLSIINALGGALKEKIISPEEYFNTSLQILTEARNEGLISDAEFNQHLAGLENPGFAINDILDAAANMIYKAEGMALKNRMLQRLYAYKAFDTQGLFVQDVDGFQPMTLPNGETRMVPKPLNTIKVEPGMAAIKVRVEGKDKIVAVNQKAAEKLTTMSNYETATVLRVLDWFNRAFRTLVITVSPGFQVVNFVIDFTRTLALSRYGPITGKGLVQPIVNAVMFMPQYVDALLHSALGNLGVETKTYKQWMASDSFSKGMFSNLFNNEKQIKQVSAPLAKRVLMNFLKLKFIEVPGTILEQTHKLAGYQRGLSVEGFKPEMLTAMFTSIINRNINPNMSENELNDAMDRINYEVQNIIGSPNFPETHKWMKIASIFLQFFSARVKGEVTDYRRVANLFTTRGEGVKLTGQERIHIMLQFLGVAGAIAGYAIMNNLNDDDEEEYDKIPPYHQDNYLNIPAGRFEYKTTDDDGYETTISLRDYAKVPLRGLTATMNVVANSFVKYYKRSNPQEFKKMGMAFMGNASPINLNGRDEHELGESAVSNLTPVFKFFLEYSFNRDTHSHRDIIPDTHGNRSMLANYRNGNIAPWEVVTDKTPDWAVKMSKFMFDELGMSVNAITLDHMENTMGNPTELYDKAIKKRLWRSEMKYPIYMSKTPPPVKEPTEEKPKE